MRRLLATALLLAAAGCGRQQALEPRPGAALPPRPALAQSTPTPDQLLAVPVDVRPGRSDELLTRSEQRPEDRFDLPPPG
ncbi:MAG: hypothetical protein PGN09_09740 [Sphingomonas fennica]